jgi:type I restriction enzyme S subunit
MVDWRRSTLGDRCLKIGSGATPRGGQEAYLGGATSLIRSQNVYNGGFARNGLAFIDEAQASELSNVEVAPDDVLLNITGDSVARCCQVPLEVLPARVNQHVSIIRTDKRQLDPRFLRYLLIEPRMQQRLLALASAGATRNALTKSMIERLEIAHPNVLEQRAIAHVLGTLDDKIDLNSRTSQTIREVARALYRDWFIDFGPVRAKAEGRDQYLCLNLWELFPAAFCESPMGLAPATWTPSTLKDQTTKIGSGATPRGGKSVYVDHGAALIRSQNVYDDEFVWDGLARITNAAAAQLTGVEVKTEDVLLNITGASILRTCVVNPAVLPARVNQHVAIIRSKSGVPSRFLHLHLTHEKTKNYLLGMNAGGSREAVTKAHIESVPLLMPSPSLLEEFGKVVAPMYQQIDAFAEESRTLANCRDLLLPRLMSGDIRIKDAERFVQEVTT